MKDTPKRASQGTGRKAEQILQGARVVFMREGFNDASVDEIARAADVSKATLYAYYHDKHLIFEEAMATVFDSPPPAPLDTIPEDLPLPSAVPRLVAAMCDWLNSRRQIALFRLAISESRRFPKFTAAYQSHIDRDLIEPLRLRLTAWNQSGETQFADVEYAAQLMVRLCDLRAFDSLRNAKTEHAAAVARAKVTATQVFLRFCQPADLEADRPQQSRAS